MRQYLEIIEQISPEEQLNRLPQEIRIEVSSKEEASNLLQVYESLFNSLNYVKRLHTCNHPDQGCTVEEL